MGATEEGGTRKRPHFKEGQPARAGPLSFSPRQGARCSARTGLAGLSRQKGWGAPCCQAAARTPRPAGLPLPTRRGWGRACQPLRAVPGPCLLASVARGSAQAPPSFQTAARAAAGRAPAVARAACLASSQPLAGRASPGLDPGPGVCRFASSVLVARGPPYDGGPAHSSACAPVAWHVAPGYRGLRSAPPALAGPYAASRAGPGASAGCGSSLSALLAALPALRCGVRICQRRAGAVVCPEGKPTACRAWRGV